MTDYEELLDRAVEQLPQKVLETKRFQVPKAYSMIQGNRTMIQNFGEITDAMNRLMEGRTTIMVAHRLSTIQHADQILVMEKGKIRERGTHQELLEQNGIYRNLYDLQLANAVQI